MKKTFVSMMLAVALLTGASAFAQTPDASTGATVQKENTQCENCPQGQKGPKGQKGNKAQKPSKPKFNPFDGIQLTNEQQQKLQLLQQGLGPVRLTPQEQAKIKENPNLTPEQKKQLKEERKAKKLEAKKNYLNGVKETLTPDQYVVFLENWYLYAPQDQGKAKAKGHDKKDGKRGDKAKMKAQKNNSDK